MMEVKVKRISWKEIETSFGKSEKIGIQTEEHGDAWLGAFANKYSLKDLKAIKEGDTIKIVTWKKGDFTNFKLAGPIDLLEERVRVLEAKAGIVAGATEETVVVPTPESTTTTTEEDTQW